MNVIYGLLILFGVIAGVTALSLCKASGKCSNTEEEFELEHPEFIGVSGKEK